MKILIVDDEKIALSSLKRLLKFRGITDVTTCIDGNKSIEIIKKNNFDIVLLDILMPDIDGLQILKKTKPYKPNTEFIMLTAIDEIVTVVDAIRNGAYDYLVKPVDTERLFLSLHHAFERKGLLDAVKSNLTQDQEIPEEFSSIITQSPKMKELIAYSHTMARGGIPIFISGESGTGKELMARSIHKAGSFPDGPFVAVNVSSIPESLFESQFFGHIKGSFTGANENHPGFFEQANRGTLFLDEIGELPLNLQPKLLRVLEEKTVTRIGSTKPIQLDIRTTSASNRDLDSACAKGRFRLDLLYRIKSAHIHLPPLRERKDDIELLSSYFLSTSAKKHNKTINGFHPDAMKKLLSGKFPGNIRELSQVIENAVLVAHSTFILPEHLKIKDIKSQISKNSRKLCSLKENYYSHIAYVLNHTEGNKKQAAQILGISTRQVQRKISEMKEDPQLKSYLKDIEIENTTDFIM